MRLSYPKSDPMNYISKFLMNSLYGRFGMVDHFNQLLILNKKDYTKFEKEWIDNITEIIHLGSNYLLTLERDDINNFLENW